MGAAHTFGRSEVLLEIILEAIPAPLASFGVGQLEKTQSRGDVNGTSSDQFDNVGQDWTGWIQDLIPRTAMHRGTDDDVGLQQMMKTRE